MKRNFFWLLVMGIICLSAVKVVTAEGEKSATVSGEEIQQIVTYIDELSNKEFDGLRNYSESDILIEKIKLINRTKNDIVTQYRGSGSYMGIMSENWQYIVPVTDGDSGFVSVFTLLKNQNGVEYAASAMGEQADVAISKYLVDDAQIETILRENGINRQDIHEEMYLMSYMYRTLFYAFTVGDDEFLIPFSDLWIGEKEYVFESGRVYPIQDAMNILQALGMESANGEEGIYGGNGGTKEMATPTKDTGGNGLHKGWIILAVAVGAALSLVLVIVVFTKRKPSGKISSEK